jgi:hypothetical protein
MLSLCVNMQGDRAFGYENRRKTRGERGEREGGEEREPKGLGSQDVIFLGKRDDCFMSRGPCVTHLCADYELKVLEKAGIVFHNFSRRLFNIAPNYCIIKLLEKICDHLGQWLP